MKNRVFAMVSRIILGSMPLTVVVGQVQAQQTQTPEPAPGQAQTDAQKNEEVLKTWQSQAPGTEVALKPAADGGTKIEFRGSAKLDAYHNDISVPEAAPGEQAVLSPLQSGTFYKMVTQGDFRSTSDQGTVAYVQGTVTSSNDRAVLSRYVNQITNFQVGYTGQDFQVMFGDVAVNYSSLSSSLGLRGLYATKQLGSYTVSGHVGIVADSWEALANRDALDDLAVRSRYLRNVYGAKLEKVVMPSLKAYATAQGYTDSERSLPAGSFALVPANTRAASTGFAYQEGQFTLNGEAAASRYREKDQETRAGSALILDAVYQLESVRYRTGFHRTSPSFVSLSQGVPPGLREGYVGADWTAASWIALGADYRDANLTTPSYTIVPPPAVPPLPALDPIIGTTSKTKSFSSRANINFGPDYAGWGLTFQDTHTRQIDALGHSMPTSNFQSSVNYSSQTWSGLFSLGQGKVNSDAQPSADSKTNSMQFMLGRQFSDASADMPASWNANASLSGGHQVQHLVVTGLSTKTSNLGLNFSYQKVNSLQLNSVIAASTTTQPMGGPDLRIFSLQIDGGYPLQWLAYPGNDAPGMFKVYLRNNLRNFNVPTLRMRETVAGIQITYLW